MKNYSKKLSLQWRLTLVTALLVTITCILMYFFISQSAVTGMDHLQNYIVQINETDSSPITFNVDPTILFPDLTEQVTTTVSAQKLKKSRHKTSPNHLKYRTVTMKSRS